MKIQFIVVGWYYNQPTMLEGLKELQENNDNIDVFYSCHKEPTQFVKDNFKYQLFPNLGEEIVAYQQALEHLNLDSDTYCFFMNDDIVIKDWVFIEKCIESLQQGYKVVGNGWNPGFKAYNPLVTIPVGITEEFDGKQSIDYAKEENRHFFEGPLEMNMARGSFLSMQYSTLEAIGGFEPRKEAWTPIHVNNNGKPYYRGKENEADTKLGGMSSFGNLFPCLSIYKVNKLYGKESITWLSTSYRNSEYLYELERGID
tara:strand:- start:770 stop:1540 length:771 start_codon:yes stop_codon:yes gene_type:complete